MNRYDRLLPQKPKDSCTSGFFAPASRDGSAHLGRIRLFIFGVRQMAAIQSARVVFPAQFKVCPRVFRMVNEARFVNSVRNHFGHIEDEI